MRQMQRGIALFALLLVLCGSLWAQITTGTISGTVKDSTGAVMPGVTVQIQNVDTGSSRTVNTDSRGYYTIPNLSLGAYAVTASLSGFRTESRRGITLNVGQNAVIDFTLQVGTMAESVVVTAEAPLVETTTATVSGLVDARQVQDLPLNARNLLELGSFYAGVSFSATGETSMSRGFGTKLTIAGTRYNANLFQIDGVDTSDGGSTTGSAAGIMMGAETIREFNVVTNAYSAEYGKHSGGVFNAVTKSGTNALHGSAFEFLRSENVDARNFFDRKVPPFTRNQFGGAVGGPIIKDRSFFFGSYEGLRERLGQTAIFNVPSRDARAGIVRGRSVPIVPEVKPYLESYPLPNGRDFGDGTAEYIAPRGFPTNEDFFTVRVDHKLSDKDSLFGRYTLDDASRIVRQNVITYNENLSRTQYAALGETRIFSPAVINQFLAGFSRTSGTADMTHFAEGFSLPLQNFTGVTAPGVIGGILVAGLADMGGRPPNMSTLNMFQFKDDVFYTTGSHSFKFGFNTQRFQLRRLEFSDTNGDFEFNSLEDFLRGTVRTFSAVIPGFNLPATYPRQSLYGLYAQDDYRVSPRLTINMGLRYEFIDTLTEKYNRLANFMDFNKPGLTMKDVSLGKPAFLNPSLKNFAPRVGLAWDPTGSGKTSIRAGIGIFHDQILVKGSLSSSISKNPPQFMSGSILTPGLARFPDAYATQGNLLSAALRFDGLQYIPDQPTVYKYSLDVQREVIPNTSVDLGFSATRGVHLLRQVIVNTLVATQRDGRIFVPQNAPYTQPFWGRVRPNNSDATSDYFALRLTLTRRFSKGFQFQTAYTWSKAIDDSSSFSGSDYANSLQTSRYLNMKDRALAAFDLRHYFSGNFSYDLPGKDLKGTAGRVLGGWQLNGVVTLRSGAPFDVRSGATPSYMTAAFIGDLPDVVLGKPYIYDTRNPDHYFDPSSFVPAPTGFIGNAGRAILTGPGSAKVDFVVKKELAFTERLHLQFRSEFFNLFNRANFGLPTNRLFDSRGGLRGDIGRITSTTTTSRQIQFGLRLVF